MECAWETLEKAGYAPARSDQRVGVFAGSAASQYLMANLYHHVDFSGAVNPLQNLLGNDKDYLTTRTSYVLDLRGPSRRSNCMFDVTCCCLYGVRQPSGLSVRPCTGRRSHRHGAAENRLHLPGRQCFLGPMDTVGPLTPGAGGTIFGSGVGIVALKRMEDALDADGDHILRRSGSAVNNDGIIKIGLHGFKRNSAG